MSRLTKLERIKSIYANLPDEYDRLYKLPQFQAEDLFTYRYIQPYLASSDTVLDIGAGGGELLDNLFIDPMLYTGIDISSDMLCLARKKYPTYSFLQLDILRYHSKHNMLVCLYGGYFSIAEIFKIVCQNLAPKGNAFFHIPTFQRYGTFISEKELELEIPMGRLHSESQLTHFRKYFNVKVVKTNAFRKLKTWMPTNLYYETIKFESLAPLPISCYNWILLHITNKEP